MESDTEVLPLVGQKETPPAAATAAGGMVFAPKGGIVP